jgi:hypothetical protein
MGIEVKNLDLLFLMSSTNCLCRCLQHPLNEFSLVGKSPFDTEDECIKFGEIEDMTHTEDKSGRSGKSDTWLPST